MGPAPTDRLTAARISSVAMQAENEITAAVAELRSNRRFRGMAELLQRRALEQTDHSRPTPSSAARLS